MKLMIVKIIILHPLYPDGRFDSMSAENGYKVFIKLVIIKIISIYPLHPDGRFDSMSAENGYKVFMKLKITNIQAEDFGAYGCSAKNSFGESNGTIKIYGEGERSGVWV